MSGLFFVEFLSCWANQKDYQEAAEYYEREMNLAFITAPRPTRYSNFNRWTGPYVAPYKKVIDYYEKAGLQNEVERVEQAYLKGIEGKNAIIERQDKATSEYYANLNASKRAERQYREDNPQIALLTDIKDQLSSLNSKLGYKYS